MDQRSHALRAAASFGSAGASKKKWIARKPTPKWYLQNDSSVGAGAPLTSMAMHKRGFGLVDASRRTPARDQQPSASRRSWRPKRLDGVAAFSQSTSHASRPSDVGRHRRSQGGSSSSSESSRFMTRALCGAKPSVRRHATPHLCSEGRPRREPTGISARRRAPAAGPRRPALDDGTAASSPTLQSQPKNGPRLAERGRRRVVSADFRGVGSAVLSKRVCRADRPMPSS